jgi:hypothetical protein
MPFSGGGTCNANSKQADVENSRASQCIALGAHPVSHPIQAAIDTSSNIKASHARIDKVKVVLAIWLQQQGQSTEGQRRT